MTADPATLEVPLATTAPLARMVAPTLCGRRGPEQDCAWYHGSWQYLRIFGLAASPARHQTFFADALGGLAATGSHSRVLVSGTADYGMLAEVLDAYGGAGAGVDATALDLCATPGVLCSWYAGFVGVPLRVVAADVLEFDDGGFDLICTHSFLSQFPVADRPRLVAAWRRLLRPGGKVVTTTRLSPEGTSGVTGFTPAQAAAFYEEALRRAGRLRDVLAVDPEVLAEEARTYATRTVGHSVASPDEVARLLEGGGLRIERLDVREIAGAAGTGEWGPGTPRTGVHAEIVACRPASRR